jgi:putative oxidoreductase
MTQVHDRSLHIVLWFGQLLLAALFGFSGFAKLTQPITALAAQMPWIIDVSATLLHFIGACEIAGAAGLVLPALTGIQPGLTPLAAVGLTTLMGLATIFHFGRGEFSYMAVALALTIATAFIAWGRLTHITLGSRVRAF